MNIRHFKNANYHRYHLSLTESNFHSPTMPLLLEGSTFLAPDGSLTLVLLASGLCPMTVAKLPEARASRPLSPIFSSRLQTMVPSGMAPTGITFPVQMLKKVNHQLLNKNSFNSSSGTSERASV